MGFCILCINFLMSWNCLATELYMFMVPRGVAFPLILDIGTSNANYLV